MSVIGVDLRVQKLKFMFQMEVDSDVCPGNDPKNINFNFWTLSSTPVTDMVRDTLTVNILGNKMMPYHVSHLS